MLSLIKALGISFGSIRSAKLRSALTTLGIVIGVAAVIANVSLGASFGQFFNEEIGTAGNNFIVIFSNDINIFFDNELEVIRNTPGIEAASPIIVQLGTVEYRSTSRNIEIYGVREDYGVIGNIDMGVGNYITDKDRFVAVLGADVANEKFDKKISNKNSIDITFRRRDGGEVTRTFRVKGILRQRDTEFAGGPDPNVLIFIPISTMNEMLGREDFNGFALSASSLEDIEEISDEVDKRLARSLGVSERDLDDEDVKPYTIFNQAEILDNVNQISTALSSLITSVAFISLLVGSIGIMNIMLVTVTERTKEIGLMKALGFSYSDILSLFIVESIVVGLFGGLLGTGLGIVASYAVETYLGLPYVFPVSLIFLGFAVSFMVGLIAGVYPANKAARMDPVEALRYH